MSEAGDGSPFEDRFGFLRNDWTVDFEGGRIAPVAEHSQMVSTLDSLAHPDGFLYPPLQQTVEIDPATSKVVKTLPNTQRPAFLRRLPASHTLNLTWCKTPDAMRSGPGPFIVNLLAYLFGTRLQFHDWWVDGRVPFKEHHTHNIHLTPKVAERFVSHAFDRWRTWPSVSQRTMTSLLYMHSRAPAYEWDWERFTTEYMVFDALWRLCVNHGKVAEAPHEARIDRLCAVLGIPVEPYIVELIVNLRNGLFHEALWGGGLPGTTMSREAVYAPIYLRSLNHRLIPAILEYDTAYLRMNWWVLGTAAF